MPTRVGVFVITARNILEHMLTVYTKETVSYYVHIRHQEVIKFLVIPIV